MKTEIRKIELKKRDQKTKGIECEIKTQKIERDRKWRNLETTLILDRRPSPTSIIYGRFPSPSISHELLTYTCSKPSYFVLSAIEYVWVEVGQ